MGPIWVLAAPGVPHVGPMNISIRGVHTGDTISREGNADAENKVNNMRSKHKKINYLRDFSNKIYVHPWYKGSTLVSVDKWVTFLPIECIKFIDLYKFIRLQCVFHKMAWINYVNPSFLRFSKIDRAWILPSVPIVYALLRVKSLKQTIQLSDQNIWDNADADQVLLKGW